MDIKTKKASVLVYSLVLVFVLIIMAVGAAQVMLTDKKGAISSRESTQAFQVADSGAEIARSKLASADPTDSLGEVFGATNCSSGKVIGSIGSGKSYEFTFTDENDALLDCDDQIADVRGIKSVGTYAGNSRAVKVAWAQAAGGSCTISLSNCAWVISPSLSVTSSSIANADATCSANQVANRVRLRRGPVSGGNYLWIGAYCCDIVCN